MLLSIQQKDLLTERGKHGIHVVEKKIFPEKSVNRGFLFSFGESGLIDTCQTMARDFSQAGQT